MNNYNKYHGIVYFIQADNGNIKIGKAQNLRKRLKSLRTMNAGKLNVLKTIRPFFMKPVYELENEIHELFKSFRLHGEWFNPELVKSPLYRNQYLEKFGEVKDNEDYRLIKSCIYNKYL